MQVVTQVGVTTEFSTTEDQRLVSRAIKERWPMTGDMRERIVEETYGILEETDDDKLKLLAANTLVKVDGLNLKERELQIRSQPKTIIHANMTMDELNERMQLLQSELGISLPVQALAALPSE